MSSLADSEATFQAKAGSYGLSDAVLKALQTKGIATYGQLLFSVASAPGQVDEAKRKTLFQAFPQEFQGEPTEGIISRLLFEAGTFVVAELKGSLESADDAPKRLSPEERTSRIQAVKKKLGSWPIGGQFEPSHHLIDLCSQMLRDRAIRYVPPSQCSSREAEIGSTRRDDQLLRLENSVLKVHSKPQAVRVDLSTDLRLYQAVCRRGLALEVSGICGYDTHEKCMRVLFDHLHRHPPAGYTAPAMEQFLRSDREIWRLVAEKVTHEFAQSGGSKLVDQALQDFCQDASVTFHLLPLPKPPPSLKRPWDQAF